MRAFTSRRLVLLSACIVLVALVFTGCGNGKLAPLFATTQATTVASPTLPPTTQATTMAPTEPLPIHFDYVSLPDEHGERRTPNVHYFVPYSDRADTSFFDDAVFIGDSVSQTLTYYNMATSCFGNATFLTSSSLSAGNALWSLDNPKSVHPSFRGQKVSLADGVAMSGKKKVYLMLGVNEIGWTGPQGSIDSLKAVVDTILAKTPDVMFYMQSVTPLSFDRGALNMKTVNEYNALLSELCRERGWYYLDVASVFRNETGYLIPEYCSDLHDMGIHFNNEACKVWVEYLYTHIPTAPAVPQVQYQPPVVQQPVVQVTDIQQNQAGQSADAQQTQVQVVHTIPVVVHTVVVQVPETTAPPETTRPKYTLPANFTKPAQETTSVALEETFEEVVME